MNTQAKPNFFASCSRNLEELLEREASTFGCENISRQKGGINFSSSHETCLEFLLHSRISSRVFKKITEFSIVSSITNKIISLWDIFSKYLSH